MDILIVLKIVFPVFCVIGLGYLFACIKTIDLDPVLDILIYITIPALVISSLSERSLLASELILTAVSVIGVVLISGGLCYIYLRITGRLDLKGLYLPTMFMNSGNMAFPLAFLAFGSEGLSVAVLYYVSVSILVYTLGIYIAKGAGGLKEIIRLPLIYAAGISIILNLARIKLPGPILDTTTMLGAATIPLMQISLGYRLRSTRIALFNKSLAASIIRIAGGIAAAYIIVTLLGIEGLNKKVIILASSMPAAVITFIMSHKYKVDSALVASTVAISTLISVVTTPIVLLWLMSMD
jgi:predicted permease